MPPKKSMLRKKRYQRKSKPVFRRKTFNVNRGLQPVAQRYICKMKYSESINILSGTGQWSLNLNSINKPNRTGTGHRPYGYNTISTLYNRYRVIACGWRIQAVQAPASVPVQLSAMPSNEVVGFTTISEYKENPRTKYVTISPGGDAQYLSGKIYLPSLVGRSRSQYMADDRYQAIMTADPQELAVLNLCANTLSDTPVAFTVNVLLEYTVEVFDIKNITQSTV